ncbi:hypothetical protein [Mangrovicoccus ximenensis]|uniref:hypothetical protein n=1 Tax=Mangrovicoccus ximenensis TaxID=1911570 RepID=UPI000D3CEF93|nr:hypothetical protein [Mangrovicoccus ximenensis]
MSFIKTFACAALAALAAFGPAAAATFTVSFSDFWITDPADPTYEYSLPSSMESFDATTEGAFPRIIGYVDTPFPAITLTLDDLDFEPSGRSYSLSGGTLEKAGFLFFGEMNEGGSVWTEAILNLSFTAEQIAAINGSAAGTRMDLPVEANLYVEVWDRSTWTRVEPDIAYKGRASASITVLTSDVAAVPLPAALPLLGAGLAGLGLMRLVDARRAGAPAVPGDGACRARAGLADC